MICLRVALPNFLSAHVFATRQLMEMPPKAQRRSNFVQVLYEISANSAEFGAKAHGIFLQSSAQSLVNKPYFKGVFGDPDWIRTNNLPLRRGLLYPVEPRSHEL